MEMIKYERVCMLMNMVKSRKVKYSKSTYKEKITSAINPYHLVGDIQGIEEDFGNSTRNAKIIH